MPLPWPGAVEAACPGRVDENEDGDYGDYGERLRTVPPSPTA